MKVTQIIAEENLDEAPVSGIRQGLRKIGAKTLAKVGAKDAAMGMAKKVDTGNQANDLYTAWRGHLGSMEKGKNQADASEFIGWAKQNKLPLKGIPQTGILKDKQIQQLIKQAVINSKSLAGQSADTSTPAPQNTATQTQDPNNTKQTTPTPTPPVDKNKDGKDDNTGKPIKATPQNTPAPTNKTIPPELQKQLDGLSPQEAKQLVDML